MRDWFDPTMWQSMWPPPQYSLKAWGHRWYHMIDFYCPYLEFVAQRSGIDPHIIAALSERLRFIPSFISALCHSMRSSKWLWNVWTPIQGAQLPTSSILTLPFYSIFGLILQYWSAIKDCPPLLNVMNTKQQSLSGIIRPENEWGEIVLSTFTARLLLIFEVHCVLFTRSQRLRCSRSKIEMQFHYVLRFNVWMTFNVKVQAAWLSKFYNPSAVHTTWLGALCSGVLQSFSIQTILTGNAKSFTRWNHHLVFLVCKLRKNAGERRGKWRVEESKYQNRHQTQTWTAFRSFCNLGNNEENNMAHVVSLDCLFYRYSMFWGFQSCPELWLTWNHISLVPANQKKSFATSTKRQFQYIWCLIVGIVLDVTMKVYDFLIYLDFIRC